MLFYKMSRNDHNTISINYSLITDCLEMKRGTAQLTECATVKRHFQLEMV